MPLKKTAIHFVHCKNELVKLKLVGDQAASKLASGEFNAIINYYIKAV